MSEVRPDRDDDVLCYCSGTTAEAIKALIEQGVDTVDRLSRVTGACSGCGSCETSLLALLADAKP